MSTLRSSSSTRRIQALLQLYVPFSNCRIIISRPTLRSTHNARVLKGCSETPPGLRIRSSSSSSSSSNRREREGERESKSKSASIPEQRSPRLDSLALSLSEREKAMERMPHPAFCRCCCGKRDCAYREHNNLVLSELERDVATSAQLGQVCEPIFFLTKRSTSYPGLWGVGFSSVLSMFSFLHARGKLLIHPNFTPPTPVPFPARSSLQMHRPQQNTHPPAAA
jgi:hypothetical protein